MGALVKETYQMLTTAARLLRRFGITIRVSRRPLTEDEWERTRVLPLYEESLAEDDEADLLDPEQVQAFRRGEIPFSAVTVKD
jgi:hypothetical protein